MLCQQVRGAFRVAPAYRIDDESVFGVDDPVAFATEQGGERAAIMLRRVPEAFDYGEQLLHPRVRVGREMKGPIQFEEGLGIGRCGHIFDQALEQIDPLVGHVRDRLCQGQRLQPFAYHVDLEALCQVDSCHPGAAARLQHD